MFGYFKNMRFFSKSGWDAVTLNGLGLSLICKSCNKIEHWNYDFKLYVENDKNIGVNSMSMQKKASVCIFFEFSRGIDMKNGLDIIL